ncbi:hypothetical protein RKE30_21745 [Streptomyces sp. Li-HN-5-11]|uniref:hypothetical protein n=1 Tax=Streptomyces sp. Li-HN-5-11 TaxID=3075432 RepID=UPI0028AF755A|nr:hypothetical protein [Streptomyces sp. Li-HN-5-11]WNM32825.1 hypothetical protein RKE30_21745 [Streptomyces sp. Li-HN-5-11]
MTTRPPGDAPLTDSADELDLPWVFVRPDSGTSKALLIKGSPLIAIGALRLGLMMAKGRGTSAGSGMTGLVIGILAVVFPLLWVGALIGLRWANAGIRLEDGVLTVRDRWNRKVLHAPVSSLTGLHTVRVPVDGPHGNRIVITSRAHRPVLIDARLWDAEGLRELWQHLHLAFQDHGFLKWPLLKKRFPGIPTPWRHVHIVLSTVLIVLGCIAYIALIVNLPFLL